MKKKLARSLSSVIVRRPGGILLLVAVICVLSFWRASLLHINHNQIDLLPQNLPAVAATNKMVKMVGTVGFLLMPLRGEDLTFTKKVAESFVPKLEELDEVHKVHFKQDVGFVRDRLGLFVKTPDLKEGYKRIRVKVREILNKSNPFAIKLQDRADKPLDLSDLVDKYRRMNKKAVDDPYYVDTSYESILLLIKPSGQNTDQEFLKRLMANVKTVVETFNQNNSIGAKLVERYDDTIPKGVTTYGYTGTFKRNLDDSESMKAAIIPTSGYAFAGILVLLLIMLRRPSQIILIMGVLTVAVGMSFAFCELVIGELNTITAILGAILLGLGIDYGIHFMFRFREEFTRRGDLVEAVHETIEHSGWASAGAAATTAAALYILGASEFKGFSDFGWVTGTGVLVSFFLMYVTLPCAYLVIDRFFPRFKESLRMPLAQGSDYEALSRRPYPYAAMILITTLALTLGLVYFATTIEFDYDSRSLMASNRPSVVLQEEIGKRWGTSSDPVGIYTDTLEEARALYDHLTPLPEESNIDTVVSIFTLVPDLKQQEDNIKILQKLKERMSLLTKDMIEDDKLRRHYDDFMTMLDAQPFAVEDLPPMIEKQFRPIPESPYKGYLTFIYPKTSLWDGEELVAFANEVGTIKVGKKAYDSAGISVIFAQLAQIVLRDGLLFTLLSAVVIFLIAWFDFRSFKGAFLATLPLVAGLIWMLGLMSLSDWHINFMNIVVFPLVFGYGISAGVQVYHRFNQSGSVMVAIRRTGEAVLASSLTTLVGWAALLASDHRGLSSLGVLACFGIASTLLVCLTVLPALLQISQNLSGKNKSDPQPIQQEITA
jgi:uncharacterized protein